MKKMLIVGFVCAALAVVFSNAWAGPKKASKEGPSTPLTADGDKLQARYAATLTALQAEIGKVLPVVPEQKKSALQQARESLKRATSNASKAQEPLNEVSRAQGLVKHGQWWVGDAKKQIAKAQADLKKATTDAARQAAQQTIAVQQKRYEAGQKELKERQATLDRVKAKAAPATGASQAAKTALAQAQANELNAAKALLGVLEPFLSSDKLDAKLVKCTVLASATPRGLAEFAQQGAEQAGLVEKLLADEKLMKEMLLAGGAKYSKYGRAMEIYTAIQKASPKAGEGCLQRLALAVALEHATPVKQSRAKDQTDATETVDPVKRYLHYEKAYLAGELDPAFKSLTTWEYRMVVDCDAPDQILAWGREMLRTYRPDHITNPNYGWRYVSAVKTDVRYGSKDVGNDLPSLHQYQNIPMNGGVCGRRAFFGRFILQCFGIPVWGVTQHAHAALSHWTPKGWVVNLGAGFSHSWWDKDEVPRSGSDFLLEAQARENSREYWKVLRAQWVSRILGEKQYNDRKNVEGGFWSGVGHYQTVVIASKAVELGPLGQELGEANAPEENEPMEPVDTTAMNHQAAATPAGTIIIPSVAHKNTTGRAATMKSATGGMQIYAGGGFKADYVIDAPQAGKYTLTARVATLQTGQKFLYSTDRAKEPVEVEVPHTVGLWQSTSPVVIALNRGQNVLQFAVKDGSRGVTIKDFTLTAVK